MTLNVFREIFSKEKIAFIFDLPKDIALTRLRAGLDSNHHFKINIFGSYIRLKRALWLDYTRAVILARITGEKDKTYIAGFARMHRFTQCFYTYMFGFSLLMFLPSVLFLERISEILIPLTAVGLFAFC